MTAAWDGVPQNPERDGWHWLVPAINPTLPPGAYCWHAPPRSDVVGMWDAGHPLDVVRRCYAYLGPCLTPAEHAAALAAAHAEGRIAGMEEAARIALDHWKNGGPPVECAAAIRAAAKESTNDR